MNKIKFQIEIDRVLDVLTKEIYDSPYALLRENIQNAYDAILMREQYSSDWPAQANGLIAVKIDNEKIIISDNGIGMSRSNLEENYWKAGSSGKTTALAMKSGVVGTFGIGGMANFGVCTKLEIETESIETKERIISEVQRDKLSLTEDCISIEKITPTGEYGTIITTILDPRNRLTVAQARSYLTPYVQYLPVEVEFDGVNLSQKTVEQGYFDPSASIQKKWVEFEHDGIKADLLIQVNDVGRVSALVNNVSISGEALKGLICLRQDSGHLWGLRSYFGLAPIPVSSFYSFGGVINISLLSPTAGREALSRESVEICNRLIRFVEECATQTLAQTTICNKSTAFMSYILSTGKISLARELEVRTAPEQEMTLGQLQEFSQKSPYKYYEGNDESIIKEYGTPDAPLVILARTNPRRRLEANFIQRFCNTEKVSDAAAVLKVYPPEIYKMDEMAFVIKTRNLLEYDYALKNVAVSFANVSHNLPYIVQSSEKGEVKIFVQRDHQTLKPYLKCYHTDYDVFGGLIRDFVRVHIYPKIRNLVPSSSREGAEAMLKILRQKRELYEISLEDIGMTSLISEFMAGKESFEEIAKRASSLKRAQEQEITRSSVGSLENEIPDLAESVTQPPEKEDMGPAIPPLPPIPRSDVDTKKKLLLVDKPNPYLNDFQMFLAVSNRAFREEYDFFAAPHTTRIIWGGHRVIYIFTHASGRLSLYYDIEMFEDSIDVAEGGSFVTTTILTKKRIFIPVPDKLKQLFELIEGKRSKRKFYVRFDTIQTRTHV